MIQSASQPAAKRFTIDEFTAEDTRQLWYTIVRNERGEYI